jgi:integral membrane protein
VTPRTIFRLVAIAEAITWTLLIAGLVLRATTGWALGVTIGGGIHGFVFLAYAATALLVGIDRRWSPGLVVLAVAAAVIPYATIPLELSLARRGRLDGDWRLDPDAAGDRTPLDALVRWFLRRPVLLLVVAAVVLVAIFTVLLLIGPPGGRE